MQFEYAPCDGQLSAVEERFGSDVREQLAAFPANHAARPTQRIPIIRRLSGEQPCVASALWGYIPPWLPTEPMQLVFHTEVEHADLQGWWRYAWRYARCLIPATAWYEIVPTQDQVAVEVSAGTLKVVDASGQIIMLAGLHGFLATPLGYRETASVLTRLAPLDLDWARQRVPCVVGCKAWNEWLHPFSSDPRRIAGILEEADVQLETRTMMQQVD
jgi:putative SOS response-associated peptidase YedK